MLTTVYYFLQVVLCSSVMMGYYWLVLRNKRFHQYNRFYLLAIALLSWIVPLIKIRWSHPVVSQDPQMIRFLSVVADNNSQIDEKLTNSGFQWSLDTTVSLIYISVAGILLLGMFRAFFHLYQLLRKHSCKNVGDVYLVLTQAKGTPFSFFRYIFWNEEIDIRSESGKQILQHELTHVQQKHSVDKVFIQLMLIAGWFNPFFWLLKKEMGMIHEFIADKKAVNTGDTASLAQMLLTAAYPQQQFALTHPFFFSPIKRRLQMLTNNRNPRFSYIRRLIVLPLLAVVVVLFSFRSKEQRAHGSLSVASVVENVVDAVSAIGSKDIKESKISVFNNAILGRTYTIVIDAGHGGADKGAMGADGTSESEITLQLAKTIRDLNTNENIHIVLTRDADIFQSVIRTAELANQNHPDLFVSLHCNVVSPVKSSDGKNLANQRNGIEFFIPAKEKAAEYERSQILASHLAASMHSLDEPMLGIRTRQKGIWVLNEVKSPAVLIETGFLTNKHDLEKLKDAVYQKQMAESILQGINNYLGKSVSSNYDTTILKADTLIVNNGQKVMIVNKGGQITVKNEGSGSTTVTNEMLNKALIILDGKKIDNEILRVLDMNMIASVDVLKNESATAKYGEEGKNGVVLVTTKPGFAAEQSNNVLLTGKNLYGKPYSNSYGKAVKYPDTLTWFPVSSHDSTRVTWFPNKPGVLRGFPLNALFIIDGVRGDMHSVDPSEISSVTVLENKTAFDKYGAEAKNGVVEIITKTKAKNGGKLNKAAAVDYGDQDKVFTEVQIQAEFPGGKPAWQKYLERNLNRDIVVEKGGPPGKYTVWVSFIVDKSGNISDVKAENNPGYGTNDEAVKIIVKGPRWKPAVQNGKNVVSVRKQSITWVVTDETHTGNATTTTKDDKIITTVQIPAEFPGGKAAWQKYLERNLNRNIVVDKGGPPGKYTVVVSFIVDKSGNVSDVKAENDPGFGTKDEAVRIIVKGPKWKPAIQNGKNVIYRNKQSITFTVTEHGAKLDPSKYEPE